MDVVKHVGGVPLHLGVGIHAQDIDVLPASRIHRVVRDTERGGLDGAVSLAVLAPREVQPHLVVEAVLGRGEQLVLLFFQELLVGRNQKLALIAKHKVREENEKLLPNDRAAVIGKLEHSPSNTLLDPGHLIGEIGDAQESGHGVRHGGANLGAVVLDQVRELVVSVLANAPPLGVRQVPPQLADAQARPLPQERVLGVLDVKQAVGHDVGRVADDLTGLEALAKHGQDERTHGLMLIKNDGGDHGDGLQRLHYSGKIGVAVVLDEVLLARDVDGQDTGPDKDHDGLELLGGRLQQLQHVGEDPDAQRQLHGPGAEVKESAEQDQGPQPVLLAEEDLKHDGQLLRGFLRDGVASCQVDLEGRELLRKERRVNVFVRDAFGLLSLQQGQLRKGHVDGEIPALPEGMAAGVGQLGVRLRVASVDGHDALGEKEVAEQGSHWVAVSREHRHMQRDGVLTHQVLPEELPEQRARESGPGNGIRNSRKDPVQLPQGRPTFLQSSGELPCPLGREVRVERVLKHKKPEGHLDGGGQAAREEIGR